jgi:hypothetical protein
MNNQRSTQSSPKVDSCGAAKSPASHSKFGKVASVLRTTHPIPKEFAWTFVICEGDDSSRMTQ